jgi:hypothetical protein
MSVTLSCRFSLSLSLSLRVSLSLSLSGDYIDLQSTFNCMSVPEMNRIIDFLLLYLIQW